MGDYGYACFVWRKDTNMAPIKFLSYLTNMRKVINLQPGRSEVVAILLFATLLLLFLAGCSSGVPTYSAPIGPAPTGGGCGVSAPAPLEKDSAKILSDSSLPV